MSKQIATSDAKPGKSGLGKKLALLGLVGVIVLVAYLQFGDALNLANLARQESQLRAFQASHPVLVFGLAFIIYVIVTGLSLPGASVLTLVYGWYFGLLQGIIVVSFASTTGATMAFLLSRFLFRDAIQRRFGDRLENFNQALEREGPFFLFTLRLNPAVPFFVINAVMGLTPIRTRTFWWVSQLGMLAGTSVYVYAGSSVPDLQTLPERIRPRAFGALIHSLLDCKPTTQTELLGSKKPTKSKQSNPRNQYGPPAAQWPRPRSSDM